MAGLVCGLGCAPQVKTTVHAGPRYRPGAIDVAAETKAIDGVVDAWHAAAAAANEEEYFGLMSDDAI